MVKSYMEDSLVRKIAAGEEIGWVNPELKPFGSVGLPVTLEEMKDAERRLERFAPFIKKCFPETEVQNGLIESELTPIPEMQHYLEHEYRQKIGGKLLLK